MRGSAVLVARVPTLSNDSLPSFPAGALPGLFIGKPCHSLQGFLQGQTLQQCVTLVERQQRYFAAIEPQEVENMIDSPIPTKFCSPTTA